MMLTLDPSALQRDGHALWNALPFDAATEGLEANAELAYCTLSRQIWLVCRNASEEIRALGQGAARSYRHALSARGPHEPAWRDFVRSVWRLVGELDRYPAQHSPRWRDARRAKRRSDRY